MLVGQKTHLSASPDPTAAARLANEVVLPEFCSPPTETCVKPGGGGGKSPGDDEDILEKGFGSENLG
jgi:hypothetical protein